MANNARLTLLVPAQAMPVGTLGDSTAVVLALGAALRGEKGDPGSSDWADISGKPAFGSASLLDAPATGDAAVDEVVKGDDSRLSDARAPTTHGHSAAGTGFAPAGNLAATNVQAALVELDGEKLNLTGGTLSGFLAITDLTAAGSSALAGSVLDLAQTWNTTGTPTAIRLNVTDTASNSASLLMDLQVGGVSKLKVDREGAVTTKRTTYFNASLTGKTHSYPYWEETNTGSPGVTDLTQFGGGGRLWFTGNYRIDFGTPPGGMSGFSNILTLGTSGTSVLYFNSGPYIQGGAGATLRLGSYWGTEIGYAGPVTVVPLTVKGIAGQTGNLQEWKLFGGTALAAIDKSGSLQLYNQLTDSSNYERLGIAWASNALTINAEFSGTGMQRNIGLQTGGGKVGIGTLNPSQLLHVNGALAVSSLRWGDSDQWSLIQDGLYRSYMGHSFEVEIGTRVLTIAGAGNAGAGNVGIGTVTPAQKLHVVGNIKSTGAVLTGSTTVSSLPSATTLGAGARHHVTDATSTAFMSTVFGGGSNKVPVVSDGTNWLIG